MLCWKWDVLQFITFLPIEGANPVLLSNKSLLYSNVAIMFSFQLYIKDMVTDFDEIHDEYLISLQQRNR